MDVKAVDTAGFVGQSGSSFGGSGSSGPGGTVVMEEWLYTFRIYSLPPNVPIQVRGYDADGRHVSTNSPDALTNSSGFYSVASLIRNNKDRLIPMRMDIVVGNPGSTQSYSYTFTEFGSLTNSKNIVLNAELKNGTLVKKVL